MDRRKALYLIASAGASVLFDVNSSFAVESDLEIKVREKVLKSSTLSPFLLKQMKSLKPYKENNISLVYEIFRDVSESSIGYGSINFDKDARIMDMGIDDFKFTIDIGLFFTTSFLNIFGSRGKYSRISDLENIRTYLELDPNFEWKKYREGIPLRGNPETTQREYVKERNKVTMNGEDFAILRGRIPLHNPLSIAFEILNGKKPNSFDMVANAKHSPKIELDYGQLNGLDDFLVVGVDFKNPIIKNFKKIHAICYNNIPVSGYIKMQHSDFDIIRGQISDIKVDGKSILKG